MVAKPSVLALWRSHRSGCLFTWVKRFAAEPGPFTRRVCQAAVEAFFARAQPSARAS